MPDIPPKGKGTIAGVKKQYVYAGGAILGVVILVVYYRSKQQAAAATTAANTVTDPSGNVCAALSPVSGYCPGTPEDLAYQGTGAAGTLEGTNAASYVGGQIIGYDQYGNPIYSSNSQQSGVPGAFTNNAQWTQAALQEMVDLEPSADPGTIADALGLYINGQSVTSAQKSVIEQAIALEGFPPVGGTNGNPPGIVDQPITSGGGGGTGGATITVPNVVKDTLNQAHSTLQSAGLTFNTDTAKDKPGYERIVTSQKPKAGTKVAKGTKVSLSWSYEKQTVNPGGKNIPPKR
jgi:hypothetical protein